MWIRITKSLADSQWSVLKCKGSSEKEVTDFVWVWMEWDGMGWGECERPLRKTLYYIILL